MVRLFGLAMVVVALAPGVAHASNPDPLEEVAPVMWGVAAYELTVTTGFVASLVQAPCESFGCVEYGLQWGMIGLGVGGLATLVASQLDAPAHGPFAYHHFATGLGSGFAAGLFAAQMSGLGIIESLFVGLGVGAAVAGGLLTYGIVRGDELTQSESASWPVHLMTWGPFLLGHFTLALVFAEEPFGLEMLILSQTLPLLIYAIAIPWAESVIESDVSAGPAPLTGLRF